MRLPDSEILQAVGVTLVMVGIVSRGFAFNARRDLARRKEHRMDARKTPDALLNRELEQPLGWFERNLGLLANLILVTGVALTVLGYARS